MSYCRFENTLRDLRDCQGALENSSSEELERLSPTEFNSLVRLVDLCGEIYRDFKPFPSIVPEE
jgi:hypothetical protein